MALLLATTAKARGRPDDAPMPPAETSPSRHIDQNEKRVKGKAIELVKETSKQLHSRLRPPTRSRLVTSWIWLHLLVNAKKKKKNIM